MRKWLWWWGGAASVAGLMAAAGGAWLWQHTDGPAADWARGAVPAMTVGAAVPWVNGVGHSAQATASTDAEGPILGTPDTDCEPLTDPIQVIDLAAIPPFRLAFDVGTSVEPPLASELIPVLFEEPYRASQPVVVQAAASAPVAATEPAPATLPHLTADDECTVTIRVGFPHVLEITTAARRNDGCSFWKYLTQGVWHDLGLTCGSAQTSSDDSTASVPAAVEKSEAAEESEELPTPRIEPYDHHHYPGCPGMGCPYGGSSRDYHPRRPLPPTREGEEECELIPQPRLKGDLPPSVECTPEPADEEESEVVPQAIGRFERSEAGSEDVPAHPEVDTMEFRPGDAKRIGTPMAEPY